MSNLHPTSIRTRTDLERLLDEQTAGVPLLGWVITWHISGEVELSDLATWVAHSGLDLHLIKIRRKTAIQRAMADWARAERVNLGAHRLTVEVLPGEREQRTVFAIMATHANPLAEDATVSTQWRMVYDRSKPEAQAFEWHCPSEVREIVEQAINHYHERYLAEDVGYSVCLPVMRGAACGVPLRANGGVYWVPVTQKWALAALQEIVAKHANVAQSDSHVMALPIVDSPSARDGMSRAAHDTLLAKLDELGEALDKIMDPHRSSAVRAKTLSNWDEEAEQIVAQAEVYSQLLQLHAGDVTAKLQALQARKATFNQTQGGASAAGLVSSLLTMSEDELRALASADQE